MVDKHTNFRKAFLHLVFVFRCEAEDPFGNSPLAKASPCIYKTRYFYYKHGRRSTIALQSISATPQNSIRSLMLKQHQMTFEMCRHIAVNPVLLSNSWSNGGVLAACARVCRKNDKLSTSTCISPVSRGPLALSARHAPRPWLLGQLRPYSGTIKEQDQRSSANKIVLSLSIEAKKRQQAAEKTKKN